jgi:hypothetical protein
MSKYALVVMAEPGEPSPGMQGRMVHAMTAAKELRAAGQEVTLLFHGIGVQWLSSMDARVDAFGRHYGALFDEVSDLIGGACEFCTVKRFGAGPSAEKLGTPLLGGGEDHHSIAGLLMDGYDVTIF